MVQEKNIFNLLCLHLFFLSIVQPKFLHIQDYFNESQEQEYVYLLSSGKASFSNAQGICLGLSRTDFGVQITNQKLLTPLDHSKRKLKNLLFQNNVFFPVYIDDILPINSKICPTLQLNETELTKEKVNCENMERFICQANIIYSEYEEEEEEKPSHFPTQSPSIESLETIANQIISSKTISYAFFGAATLILSLIVLCIAFKKKIMVMKSIRTKFRNQSVQIQDMESIDNRRPSGIHFNSLSLNRNASIFSKATVNKKQHKYSDFTVSSGKPYSTNTMQTDLSNYPDTQSIQTKSILTTIEETQNSVNLSSVRGRF
eukprot:maker-scaffold_24-snap-gene-3.34-mRNA-1 protein AED:0.00 eAED:0.00 QI:114/1/1/1/1/1/2/176/316